VKREFERERTQWRKHILNEEDCRSEEDQRVVGSQVCIVECTYVLRAGQHADPGAQTFGVQRTAHPGPQTTVWTVHVFVILLNAEDSPRERERLHVVH